MNTDAVLQLDRFFTTGMSPFQMRNFVVNDFVTTFRKIRQSVVEIKARIDNRASLELDIEELCVQIEQTQNHTSTDQYQTRLNDIQRRRYELQHRQKMGLLVQLDFEISEFMKTLDTLVLSQGGYDRLVERLQDPEFQECEEAHFWIEKMSRAAHADLINFGTISKGTLETIMLLPQDDQRSVMVKALELQSDTVRMLSDSRDTVLIAND